jgi:hypothetical protein
MWALRAPDMTSSTGLPAEARRELRRLVSSRADLLKSAGNPDIGGRETAAREIVALERRGLAKKLCQRAVQAAAEF